MATMHFRGALGLGLVLVCGGLLRADDATIDLARAVVVEPATATAAEKRAVRLLVDDVARRSGVTWPVVQTWPDDAPAVVAVGAYAAVADLAGPRGGAFANLPRSIGPEGYRIHTEPGQGKPAVLVAGVDSRGVLFGAGRLLRELRTSKGRIALPASFQIATSPKYPLRGHQLGYRPKTNSYDAWDLPRWERYIRDLAIFGANAVELLPPRTDDDAYSPHFPLPPMEMMVGMSKLLDDYGLDVWVWYPAMDPDYSKPEAVEAELKQWDEVLSKLPRVDAVFVPGGDPGHTPPKVLMPFLERVAGVLHRSHPKAALWVSPQGFNQEWTDEFVAILKQEPAWLAGVVHGPQVRLSMSDLRKAVPARYPIRAYPDITHNQQCQFPAPDWDLAFSNCEGRESINPRPTQQAAIFKYYQPGTIGSLTYSEGCNDDVNKCVWSALGWDPDADVAEILRQYARAYIDDAQADRFAEGLLGLERNWRGPIATNPSIDKTLNLFRDLENEAGLATRANWRFQQAVYRAYYDAYVRDRRAVEQDQEKQAYDVLRKYSSLGAGAAVEQADAILAKAAAEPFAGPLKARLRALAEDLFLSIGMQLSVPLYDAIGVDRGANLDTIDVPLNDRLWLRARLAELKRNPNEAEQADGVRAIVERTDPGPGGFYDDLGDLARQPHLVRPVDYADDPDFRRSPVVGFGTRAGWPVAWSQNAQIVYDAPVQVHYDGLDPKAAYRVKVVYAGDSFRNKLRLDADGEVVHDWLQKPVNPAPLEFAVPAKATADGSLTLSWRQEPGKGANGRGNQIAEVWLLRNGSR
ncbi:hypothetical protein [Paludisphaera borealis]|uniref:Beta-hexosaminidase bacterial type N-terminal domain-containing protein n=1 Tax=Paludisphaera borealis TaxID=1387353 RepID=A0A1U7CYP4_9BACT|nr:hypothetical protein [Paludisphaera borealis]APW64026.1 hypothetical protein BSF38_05615 [Paludisphaera borealis]